MKNVKEITKEIKNEEWANYLKDAFNKKKKDIKIDGFRKGSVTWDLFVKKVGIETLYPDAADIAIEKEYEGAFKEADVIPVIQPTVDITKLDKDGITIVYKFISKPEVKLGDYKNLGIKKETAKVTKKDVEEEINRLRDRYADIVVKENGEVVKGNTAVIDFKGIVDGKELEGGTGENYPLEIGSNTFIPGFEDALIGMKVGETKDISLKFPENYVENLKGKDVTFTVTIREIKERVLPEIDEELFKDLGYEDIKTKEEFETKVKENLLEHKNNDIENKYLDEVIKKAVENMTVDINEEIIHEEIHRLVHQYEDNMRMQGLSLEQYFEFTKTNMEQLEEQLKPEAEMRVKERYLLEAVSEKENIEVDDKESETHLEEIANTYNIPKDELLNQIGGMDMIKFDLKMKKALEFLKNN